MCKAIPFGYEYFNDPETAIAPFKCDCGYEGKALELLYIYGGTTSWCPKCKQDNWEFV